MRKSYGSDRFYEDLYTSAYEDTQEEQIETALRNKDISHYRMKTITSGNIRECEIYPVWNTRSAGHRARKEKASRKAQQNLNDKNTKKKLIRLLNANFTEQDIWATFTYDKAHLPNTPEQAEKNIQNYIRRLAHHKKKNGGQPLKYVYVTEYEEDQQKGKKRVHHHLVVNFQDRDFVEKLWKGGARTHTRRLQPDESGLEGLARYISKDPKGKKRYVCSRNLSKPTVTVSDHRMTRTKARKIVENINEAPALFTKIYEGYSFTDIKAYFSEYASGAYIYVKLRKYPERKKKPAPKATNKNTKTNRRMAK